ncbi:ketoreductase or glucose dehydrogenase [Yersinia phage vB_Yru_GN1]|uniref:Ketoreductase or glucose dehydrogenase n=1 Tax=Yersinia phage vB_Yru_GN1 TaxID=3074381 RepID=A0AA86MDD2_9CAUD|nr:ketoreductase or glucose dehydrogenase [Yersinia phage vB_Yru_GN1]
MRILITGATSGVGLDFLKLIADEKYNHVNVDILIRKMNDEVREIQSKTDGRIKAFIVDLSQPSSLSFNSTMRLISNVHHDVVINNAGITNRNYLEAHGSQDILDIMNVNTITPMLITKATISDQEPQLFVNILSGAAKENFRKLSAYGTSKAALAKFFDQLYVDYQDKDIHNKAFVDLNPGPIDTKLCPESYKDGRVKLLTGTEVAESIIKCIDEFNEDQYQLIRKKIDL